MLSNQMARLKIWQGLQNPFDYNEFCVKCREVDITPMCMLEFSHKVGMLLVARSEFPGLADEKAYTLIASKTALQPEDQARLDVMMAQLQAERKRLNDPALTVQMHKCGGCSGGRVR